MDDQANPVGLVPEGGVLAAVRAVPAARPFGGEGHRKLRAGLRLTGTRTLLGRGFRLMRPNR